MAVRRLTLIRWTSLCAAAEAVGMTAAAAAARISQTLVGEPGGSRETTLALSLVVAGGLVEGVALGGLQAAGLGRLLPGLNRRTWLLVTVLVAGLGWATASAPAVLSGDDGGAAPPLLLILGGAAGLGVVMGAVLGAAQASVLRAHVRHPWRWVGANAAAWAPAMAVIFLGATAPDPDWPAAVVVALGTVTGLLAGSVLGLVTWWFLPSLDGAPARNRVVVGLLGSPVHRMLDGPLLVLRIRGAVTGCAIELPVQYADADTSVVVVPGRPETKRWWRNLAEAAPVEVLLRGQWRHGDGTLLHPGEPGYDTALAAYQRRWPRLDIPADSLLVLVRLATLSQTAGRTPPSPRDAG